MVGRFKNVMDSKAGMIQLVERVILGGEDL